MKYSIYFASLLLAVVTLGQSKREIKSTTIEGKKVKYGILLPKNFDPNQTYPVAIGPSEVKGPDDQSYYWRGIKDTKGWILLDYPIYDASNRVAEIKSFMGFVRKNYKVEGSKFHTVCFSANSAGIFDLVMKMPEDFHSITGMAGNPSSRNTNDFKKLEKVKVRFIVGDKDTYWMNAAKDRHQKMLDAGIDSKIEIIKNGKHVLTDFIGSKMVDHFETLR